MWHKAEWMECQMRLGHTHVGLLIKLANRYTTRDALGLVSMIYDKKKVSIKLKYQ